MHEQTTPIASVIIPAHDAAETIGRQLDALAVQVDVGPLEVIVVDNRSTDGTAEAAERHRPRLPFLAVVPAAAKPGVSYARNVGIDHATTDRILFCDADDEVAPDWAARLLGRLHEAALVSGRSIWVDADRSFLHDDTPYGAALGFLPSFGANNAAVRREVLLELRGFDETLQTAEDLDLAWRLQLAGHHIVKEDRATVTYYQRGGARDILRREFHHGRGTVEIYRRYRRLGMPRSSVAVAAKAWLMFLLRAPFVWNDPGRKRFWLVRVGTRAGRLWGSARSGTLYL